MSDEKLKDLLFYCNNKSNIFLNSQLIPFWYNLFFDLKNNNFHNIKEKNKLDLYFFNISIRIYKLLSADDKLLFFKLYNLLIENFKHDSSIYKDNFFTIKIIIDSLTDFDIHSEYIRCFVSAYLICFLEVKNLKDNSLLINDINHLHFYIGRYNKYKNLKASSLHNPFIISDSCSRYDSIKKYKNYLVKQIFVYKNLDVISEIDDILLNISKQKFVYLLCWCKPLPCHGDVIIKICLYLILLNYKYFIINNLFH